MAKFKDRENVIKEQEEKVSRIIDDFTTDFEAEYAFDKTKFYDFLNAYKEFCNALFEKRHTEEQEETESNVIYQEFERIKKVFGGEPSEKTPLHLKLLRAFNISQIVKRGVQKNKEIIDAAEKTDEGKPRLKASDLKELVTHFAASETAAKSIGLTEEGLREVLDALAKIHELVEGLKAISVPIPEETKAHFETASKHLIEVIAEVKYFLESETKTNVAKLHELLGGQSGEK
jgi:hypothetical protein